MISGGERQLVLLARALAQEPQFIVLDEPTASLDFGNQGKVMREIRALAASGHGVLFTTHDPNHALRAADRAYLLRDGERSPKARSARCSRGTQLEALYGAPVERLTDAATGAVGLSPGMIDTMELRAGDARSSRATSRLIIEESNYGTRTFALAYRHSAADHSVDLAVRRPARLSTNLLSFGDWLSDAADRAHVRKSPAGPLGFSVFRASRPVIESAAR